MQHFGIKVSIIEPGFFKTAVTSPDVIDANLRRLWTRLPQDVKDSYGTTYIDECKKKISMKGKPVLVLVTESSSLVLNLIPDRILIKTVQDCFIYPLPYCDWTLVYLSFFFFI